jgi:hypothetical protein
MSSTEDDRPPSEAQPEPVSAETEPVIDETAPEESADMPAETVAAVLTPDSEPERRRISDYLGDVSRLEVELAAVRQQNEELRAEVLYQRRRIEREEEARVQLMQLLDNSQRLLGNSQRHTQHLLGGNEAEIFTMALAEAKDPGGGETPEDGSPQLAAPRPKPRRRWWIWG